MSKNVFIRFEVSDDSLDLHETLCKAFLTNADFHEQNDDALETLFLNVVDIEQIPTPEGF
jgi:hypothetical protein